MARLHFSKLIDDACLMVCASYLYESSLHSCQVCFPLMFVATYSLLLVPHIVSCLAVFLFCSHVSFGVDSTPPLRVRRTPECSRNNVVCSLNVGSKSNFVGFAWMQNGSHCSNSVLQGRCSHRQPVVRSGGSPRGSAPARLRHLRCCEHEWRAGCVARCSRMPVKSLCTASVPTT